MDSGRRTRSMDAATRKSSISPHASMPAPPKKKSRVDSAQSSESSDKQAESVAVSATMQQASTASASNENEVESQAHAKSSESSDKQAESEAVQLTSCNPAQQPTSSANASNANEDGDDHQAERPIWEYERTFQNQAELDAFMKEEKCWALSKTEYLVKGIKSTFRCNNCKRRGPKCASGLYTLKNYDQIHVFRLRAEHDCDKSANRAVPKISDEVRQFILDQYKLGNPPATIRFKLRELKNIEQPTKEQVTHIINYYKEKNPNPVVSIADMENFAKEHSKIPEDEDEGFVVNFECSAPRTPPAQKFFRIFYSTKRLLKYAQQFDLSHADGTYKMLVQGYPVLDVGFSDADKHFHLSGLVVASSETTADYKFLFDSLHIGVKAVTNQDLKINHLIADMAPAITEGLVQSVGNSSFTRIHCFSHVMSNVEKQKFKNADNKDAIKADLRRLQLVHDKNLFEIGWKLLAKKWKMQEPDFIAYFEKVYIQTNPNWFEGIADRVPKTNNCLETFHRLMKQQQTQYVRKPLNQFMYLALTIVRQRSMAYIHDKKPPTKTVTISDELTLKGWEYAQSKKTMHYQKSPDGISSYYVYSGEKLDKVTSGDVRKWEKGSYKNFDDFVQQTTSMYRISFVDLSQLDTAKCTCGSYAKNNMCKHILMVAYRNQTIDPPDELLKTVESPAPEKNKRGRPKKTTKALLVD